MGMKLIIAGLATVEALGADIMVIDPKDELRVDRVEVADNGFDVTINATKVTPPAPLSPPVSIFSDQILAVAELDLLNAGNRIQAIKAVRGRTALGLKEAKDLCDRAVPPKPFCGSPFAQPKFVRGDAQILRDIVGDIVAGDEDTGFLGRILEALDAAGTAYRGGRPYSLQPSPSVRMGSARL